MKVEAFHLDGTMGQWIWAVLSEDRRVIFVHLERWKCDDYVARNNPDKQCPACEGEGAVPFMAGSSTECDECMGTGLRDRHDQEDDRD